VERLSLSKQRSLQRLDASDNRLRSVSSLGLGAQSGLEELSLGMNPVDRLNAEGMASVPFLHVLVFGGCVQGLSIDQDAFRHNTQVTHKWPRSMLLKL
jgi:Leucine-rich repeat (LRR) protein